MDAADQQALDEKLIAVDGSPNKGRLGANALLGVSMAASRAAALSARKPLYRVLRDAFYLTDVEPLLPTPMFNIVNGGKHADSGLDVQEFMVVPVGASSFGEALRMGVEVYQALKKLLALRGLSTAVGDEGGFAPRVSAHQDALDLIMEAVSKSGFEGKVALAIDAAASEFFRILPICSRRRSSPRPNSSAATPFGPVPTPSSPSRTLWPRTIGPPGGR